MVLSDSVAAHSYNSELKSSFLHNILLLVCSSAALMVSESILLSDVTPAGDSSPTRRVHVENYYD